MASNDNVIDLLDDSSDDDSRRRKRRREHVAAAPAPAAASNVDVFEIDDSDDDDDDDGNTKGAAAGVDDSVEILSPPAAPAAAAAAAQSPGSSDGSAIEMISPFTAARQRRMNGMGIGIDDDHDAKPAAAAAAAATTASSKPPADTPLHRIVIIFPDICPNHARENLRRVGINPTRIDATDGITPAEEQMISVALSNLVEGGSYPKSETLARGNAGGDGRGGMVGGGLLVASKSRPLRCRLHHLRRRHRLLRPQRLGSSPGFHLVQPLPRHIIHRAFP